MKYSGRGLKEEHHEEVIQIVVPPGFLRGRLLEFLNNRGQDIMYLPSKDSDDLPTYTIGPVGRFQ